MYQIISSKHELDVNACTLKYNSCFVFDVEIVVIRCRNYAMVCYGMLWKSGKASF